MNSFSAIDALLAAHTPLPPPAERVRLRQHLDLAADQVAQALGTDTATLTAWESGAAEPEGLPRTAYAYLLTRAQAIAELHPAARRPTPDTTIETLPQPAPCVLCGHPANQQVAGYPQHLTTVDCTAAAAPSPPPPPRSRPTRPATAAGGRIPSPRSSAPRSSDFLRDPIREAVAAALAAHEGDLHKATTALVGRAIPDAMRLFNASRVGGRYDIIHHPALPEMLRKPSPRAPDRIWEARPNWQRPHAPEKTGTVTALDINGAYLSALKTHLPLGQLQPTPPQPHDRHRSGIHLITPPTWEHDSYLPNPLGARHEPGPVWITEATLRLLLRLSGPKHALCDPPTIHESYTSGSTENLFEKFRTTLRDARTRALKEKDAVTLDYVKAMYAKLVSTMGESTYNKELCRPDWMHIIHSQAFANLWAKAYTAHTRGLTLVRVCGTDELHLQGDWRGIFEEGPELNKVKLKNTYALDTVSPQAQQTHTACSDPIVEQRRYEYAGGRYVGCRACGGDLCTSCRAAHLVPSDVAYEFNDDNLCPACRQTG